MMLKLNLWPTIRNAITSIKLRNIVNYVKYKNSWISLTLACCHNIKIFIFLYICKISVNSPSLDIMPIATKIDMVHDDILAISWHYTGDHIRPFAKWLGRSTCIPSVDDLFVKFTDKNNFQYINNPCSIVLVFLMGILDS